MSGGTQLENFKINEMQKNSGVLYSCPVTRTNYMIPCN